jgi:hypothetical protein
LIVSFLIGNYLGKEKIAEISTDSLPISNDSELLDNEVIVESGCLPITIIFDLSTVTVVDVGGGNACFPNAPTEVFGKPCSETNLCDVALNTREHP